MILKPFKIVGSETSEIVKIADTNLVDFISLDANTDIVKINPFIRKAIDFNVLPYIGQEVFNILAEYDGEDSDLLKLLQLLRSCIAEYAVAIGLPTLRLTIGNGGVAENTPQNSAPAPQWATKAAERTAWNNGDLYLDMLLAKLAVMQMSEYINADEYKRGTTLLFKHTLDLNEYINIHKSRRTYEVLVKFLKNAESELNLAVCGSWIFNTDNKQLLEMAKKYVAHKGLAVAIPFLKLKVEADGVKALSYSDGGFTDAKSLTNNNQAEAIAYMRIQAEQIAIDTLNQIKLYLKNNKITFTEWANSPCGQEVRTKGNRVIGESTGAILFS